MINNSAFVNNRKSHVYLDSFVFFSKSVIILLIVKIVYWRSFIINFGYLFLSSINPIVACVYIVLLCVNLILSCVNLIRSFILEKLTLQVLYSKTRLEKMCNILFQCIICYPSPFWSNIRCKKSVLYIYIFTRLYGNSLMIV